MRAPALLTPLLPAPAGCEMSHVFLRSPRPHIRKKKNLKMMEEAWTPPETKPWKELAKS